MFYGAKPEIFRRARMLRVKMTIEEKLLWNKLKDNQLSFRFKPQHPIDIYIADFYCHALKLVIEIRIRLFSHFLCHHRLRNSLGFKNQLTAHKFGLKRIDKMANLHIPPSGNGEIGRRTILRGWRRFSVGVQIPLPAQSCLELELFEYLNGFLWIM